MTRKVELDGVLLTPQAVEAWSRTSKRIVIALKKAGSPVEPSQVGEEYAEFDTETGVLTIKCQVGRLVASLEVSPGQWSWNN